MDEIESLLNRPKSYSNIDGVGELGGGVMCLGYALFLWLLIHSAANSAWHQVSIFAFAGLILVIHFSTKAIKKHITYPRTGFVEYRKRWLTTIVAMAFGALIALTLVYGRHWDIATPASLIGLVFAAAYAHHFARAIRWKWLVVCAIVLVSLVIAFLPADVFDALANDSGAADPDRAKLAGTILLSLMAYGTILLISGGISFWLYLRHTEAPEPEVP